ncbi:MAG: hypothetical protein AB1414_08870 [bacterium]
MVFDKSLCVFANDLTDGSGWKINGSQRFIAGLNYMGTDFSKVLPKGLNNLHLPFSNTILPGAVEYMTKTYQLGVAATGKEGVLFGKELSDEERINIGTKLVGSSIGNIIGNGIDYATDEEPETGITDALKQEGMNFYKGAQAWSQMAVQAYQNASNLASYLHFGPNNTTNNNIPKDQDAYIKLDFAHEIWQSIKSIGQAGENILTTIRDTVRDYQQDYARYVAFKKGELTIEAIKQQVESKQLSVDDVLDLAQRVKRYGGDATELIKLYSDRVTPSQLRAMIEANQDPTITNILIDKWNKDYANGWIEGYNFYYEKVGEDGEVSNPLDKMKDDVLNSKLEDLAGKNELTGVEKDRAHDLLAEYLRRNNNQGTWGIKGKEAEIGIKVADDVAKKVLKYYLGNLGKGLVIARYLVQGEIDKAIFQLDPTHIADIADIAYKTVRYGGYINDLARTQLGEIGFYQKGIEDYAHYINMPPNMSNLGIDFFNLPASTFIKADIRYYMGHGSHIGGTNNWLPEQIKGWIEEAAKPYR